MRHAKSCWADRCRALALADRQFIALHSAAALALALFGLSGLSMRARAEPLDAAQNVRTQGCGMHRGVNAPLRQQAALDLAAQRWSQGGTLHDAIMRSGYSATNSAAIHVRGDGGALDAALATQFCAPLSNTALSDIGSAHRGNDTWIVLAAPFNAPAQIDAARIDERILTLVNRARSQARRCGQTLNAAAPRLKSAPALTRAAAAHALDMATRGYFSHQGPGGDTPAARVRQAGYAYRIVGENIAAGPTTAEEVVQGWLDSPGHCENIMDPRFSDVGVAYATNPGKLEVYWAQVFAAPR